MLVSSSPLEQFDDWSGFFAFIVPTVFLCMALDYDNDDVATLLADDGEELDVEIEGAEMCITDFREAHSHLCYTFANHSPAILKCTRTKPRPAPSSTSTWTPSSSRSKNSTTLPSRASPSS